MDIENQRQFKGVWIPAEIWTSQDLSWKEKILLIEIDSLTSKNLDCFFSDEYIAELLGVHTTYANKVLSSLISKGYIEKTRFDGRRRYVRSLLEFSAKQGCTKVQGCLVKTADQGCTGVQSRVAEKCNHNNTCIINNITNKDNSYPPLPPLSHDSHSATEQEMFENRYSGPEVINELEPELPFRSKAFSDAWKKLLRQPKWKGRTIESLEANLGILAKHSEQEAIAMINDAIAGNYQKLVEPKPEFQRKKTDAELRREREERSARNCQLDHEKYIEGCKKWKAERELKRLMENSNQAQ